MEKKFKAIDIPEGIRLEKITTKEETEPEMVVRILCGNGKPEEYLAKYGKPIEDRYSN